MDTCPKCGKSDTLEPIREKVPCLCDKSNCYGQRCGANDMVKRYKCKECEGVEFNSIEYNHYINRHCT